MKQNRVKYHGATMASNTVLCISCGREVPGLLDADAAMNGASDNRSLFAECHGCELRRVDQLAVDCGRYYAPEMLQGLRAHGGAKC